MFEVDVQLFVLHVSIGSILSILVIISAVGATRLVMARVPVRKIWRQVSRPRITVKPHSPFSKKAAHYFLMVACCAIAVMLLVNTLYSAASALSVSNVWAGMILALLTAALFRLYLHYYREAHRIRRALLGLRL